MKYFITNYVKFQRLRDDVSVLLLHRAAAEDGADQMNGMRSEPEDEPVITITLWHRLNPALPLWFKLQVGNNTAKQPVKQEHHLTLHY